MGEHDTATTAVEAAYREHRAQVLAASIRTPNHVIEAAKAGADIATLPAAVFNSLFKHALTDVGMTRFLSDWKTLPNYEEAIFPKKQAAGAR